MSTRRKPTGKTHILAYGNRNFKRGTPTNRRKKAYIYF
jgi:hypothetical protein